LVVAKYQMGDSFTESKEIMLLVGMNTSCTHVVYILEINVYILFKIKQNSAYFCCGFGKVMLIC